MIRRAFSIVECATATVVVGVLSAAVINGVAAVGKTRQLAQDRAIGQRLADGLATEMLNYPFYKPGSTATVIGPLPAETAGPGRTLYDDFDDYHGLNDSPVSDWGGTAIPGLEAWSRRVTVEYVDPSNLSTVSVAATRRKRATITVYKNGAAVATATVYRTPGADDSLVLQPSGPDASGVTRSLEKP